MSIDVKIKTNDSIFKLRVSGILVKDNKILTVQINNNDFFCLPGGHIELNEDSKEAVIREFVEETNISVKIKSQIAITENFFTNINGYKVHEIGIYYLLESNSNINTEDFNKIEKDKNEETFLNFKWVNTKDIDKINFKPKFLVDKIIKNDYQFEHVIIKVI